MKDFSYITNSSPAFIENLYHDFVKDPASVDPDFRKFFEGFDFAVSNGLTKTNGTAIGEKKEIKPAIAVGEEIDWKKEIQAYRLIVGYRNKGHLIAKTNPIRERKDRGANLDLKFFGFTDADLDKEFYAGNFIGVGRTTIRNIIEQLQ